MANTIASTAEIATQLHQPVIDEVIQQLQSYIRSNPNALPCTCEQCLLDVAALALNQLPPKYATTERGSFLVRFELQSRQAQLDIFLAIQKAIELVKKNPRHSLTNSQDR